MLYLRHLVPDVVNFAMVLEVFFVEVVVSNGNGGGCCL